MSELTRFLTINYASHFGVIWEPTSMAIREEKPAAICFEIEDLKPTIIQPSGKGVSIIRSSSEVVEIIDLESFTKQIHGEEQMPSCCDFAISPTIGTRFLVLNELTRTKSDFILHFRQKETGVEQEGKLEKAKHQLETTINRFYEVSDFCDQYQEKTALFSCRLSDKSSNGIMARSAKMFSSGIYKLQRMQLRDKLPHGFTFKMRIYNQEYRLN